MSASLKVARHARLRNKLSVGYFPFSKRTPMSRNNATTASGRVLLSGSSWSVPRPSLADNPFRPCRPNRIRICANRSRSFIAAVSGSSFSAGTAMAHHRSPVMISTEISVLFHLGSRLALVTLDAPPVRAISPFLKRWTSRRHLKPPWLPRSPAVLPSIWKHRAAFPSGHLTPRRQAREAVEQ
ncbi:hypothetical protein CITSP_04909 [Citrobacter sp. T1.2D-1]|nr:hypothetical protein CITSP_04909 [Citrobacter sp. T1.2D-1]